MRHNLLVPRPIEWGAYLDLATTCSKAERSMNSSWAIENVIKLGPNHNLKGIPPKEMARILVCNSVRAIG